MKNIAPGCINGHYFMNIITPQATKIPQAKSAMATHALSLAPHMPTLKTQLLAPTLSFTPKIAGFAVQFGASSRSLRISAVSATPAVETGRPATSNGPAKVLPFRIGHGFDLHRLEPGYPLIIGGVNIPHDRGCEAHSDGDVLLHCIVDAILGALGLPDIGQIFPDTDPKWKGAPSSVFIKEAVRLMNEAGYEIGNLDATLILQRPKISPHKEVIKAKVCELLGADPSSVNLKAKTHEKVDSLGENRSIAAHTVVLLMKS